MVTLLLDVLFQFLLALDGQHAVRQLDLDVLLVEAGQIGDILISRPRVVRSTRSLIFMSTEVMVDERTAEGNELKEKIEKAVEEKVTDESKEKVIAKSGRAKKKEDK